MDIAGAAEAVPFPKLLIDVRRVPKKAGKIVKAVTLVML